MPDPALSRCLPTHASGLLCCLVLSCFASRTAVAAASPVGAARPLTFAFWNVENLFDSDDDPANPGDDEYLPARGWDAERYHRKLDHLAEVISAVDPDLIGFAELENRRVLADLTHHEKLAKSNYQIAHIESPDKRGIDVALIFRAPIELGSREPVLHEIAIDPPTRGVLEVTLTCNGHELTVLVNHWPSRGGGAKSVEYRRLAGEVARRVVTSVEERAKAAGRDSDQLLMGDFNDDPFDPSVRDALGAIRSRNAVLNRNNRYALYNPTWKFLGHADVGTLYYNREWVWNVFDQAIVSRGLLKADAFKFVEGSLAIYGPDKLRDKYRRPLRFRRRGKNWTEGYSDHLLVFGKLEVAASAPTGNPQPPKVQPPKSANANGERAPGAAQGI